MKKKEERRARFDQRPSPDNRATNRSSSVPRTEKGTEVAPFWGKITKEPALSERARERQRCLRRRLSLFRCTAVPKALRRTKIAPEASRPGRIHRTSPLVQPRDGEETKGENLDYQTLATLAPPSGQHRASTRRTHTSSKTMLVPTLAIAGLVCAFHL